MSHPAVGAWRLGRLATHHLGIWLLVGLVAGFLPGPASAQQPALSGDDEPQYVVPRLSGPIVLNGRVDESAWEGVEPLSAVMHLPTFGGEPTERTEFLLGHDGKYLYFACLAYDSQPDGIQVTSLRRDATTRADDNCALYLDTFNDEENAVTFMTTPSGRRIDQALANDAEGGPNFDWNTFWDTAVVRNEQGWFVEMRIPFSSLLFQTENGHVVMGMSIRRLVARKNEIITHPAVSPSLGSDSYRKPSLMRKIALEGVERVDPIYVTPYALGGWGRTNTLSREDRVYNRLIDRVAEAGLDVKYGLTSNLGLDLSLNTDFAQVEADDQQVNLTRFSLFFPEKRRFFQERAAIFEYPLGGNERLFHSRNIGLVNGEPVRIYGGGRVVGRVGPWDVGFLNMQTADSDLLPSENHGVLRLRRRVLNENSYVGAITTSRLATGGHHNVVYGFDGLFRVVGFDYLTLNWAQSFDGREPAGSSGTLDRALVRVNWERRGQDGLLYSLDVTRAGEIFEPRLGFLLRRDYAKGDLSVGYGWRPQGARLLRYSLTFDGTVVRRLADGTVETVEAGPVAVFETRGRHTWTLSIPVSYENLIEPFSLPENTFVPPGTYDFAGGRVQYQAPQGDRLRPNVTFEAGQFYDGRQASLSIGTDWNPSMHLFLGALYRADRVEFSDRGQEFTAHVGRLRAEVMFTTKTSALGFVQFNSTQNAIVGNFRFHYTPREGNDLYLVWNENLTTDRHSFDPVRPLSNERTIMIKYSHTLPFGI
jgi:hypothetical protein